jgi:serine/threonine-protein kinase
MAGHFPILSIARFTKEMMDEARAPHRIGRDFGPYRILSLLGSGGMGDVFLARDGRLGRDVAVKFLPLDLGSSPERRGRFEREARLLAALNHPNIATLYGFEEYDGTAALVLELIEGPTLAERLAGGALPVREAIAFAGQIAEALEAAHEKRIVHRDLKPANVKLTAGGVLKVLDFGLAKETGEAPRADHSQAPTRSAGETRDGLVVGTASYMSPEQARGLAVDRRTDLWAFGCVLYEMLAGRKAFSGATVSDTIAAVLQKEPDWTALPAKAPPNLLHLLRRCLEKDPRKRLRDAGDARLDLDDALSGPPSREQTATPRSLSRVLGVLALLTLSATSSMVWVLARKSDGPLPVIRTTVMLPSRHELDSEPGAYPLTLSPDGRRIAYVARDEGRAQLYVRDLDSFEAKPIPGTEGARFPVFSPDAGWVAFFADDKLKRVSVDGGAPIPICDAPGSGRGASWGTDGTIVFDTGAGLARVRADGGEPAPLSVLEAGIDPADLHWPHFLPGRRAIVATAAARRPERERETLVTLDLDSGELRRLGPGSQAQYTTPGYLVFHSPHVREGAIEAAPFDPGKLTLTGPAISVLDGSFRARNAGGAYFAVARHGTLVFAPGGLAHTLVRVQRNGRRTPLTAERRGFRFPRISPDGSRVAVTIDPRPSEIWIYDIARQTRVPLAREGHSIGAVWRIDGERVDFSLRSDIYSIRADGSAAAEPFLSIEHAQYPQHWSPDGSLLLFHAGLPAGFDIWVKPLSGEAAPLIATPASEYAGRISPDGRWLAYSTDESGRVEVSVRPFPDVNSGKWVVSTGGGHTPVWSPDGRELFYVRGSSLMAVPIETRGARLAPGTPLELFDGPFDTTQDNNYDVSPDGKYFVMVETDPDARPTRIQLVLNWPEELERRAPRDP